MSGSEKSVMTISQYYLSKVLKRWSQGLTDLSELVGVGPWGKAPDRGQQVIGVGAQWVSMGSLGLDRPALESRLCLLVAA